ncbi:MAG TPA: hypothetical protein VFW60_08810 [Rhodanobacteraceae bacterium]|nr:hypothetical protein [Rhodanobacteraceae bacterium]
MAAIIASLIGFLALLVGGYTAWVQRYTANIQLEQVRAQVWPYLAMGSNNGGGDYEIFFENKGVGPAVVRSVQVFAKGRSVSGWDQMMKLLAFKPKERYARSPLNGVVLSPGETRHWIRFQNAADAVAFLTEWGRDKIQVRICYSSSLGDDWLLVQGLGRPERPRPVPGCPKISDSEQFHD